MLFRSNVKEGANNLFSKIKENKTLSIVCCAVCAIVVIALLSLIFGSIFGGSKNVVKSYVKVNYIKPNAKKACKMMHKNIVESVYDDLDECIEKGEEALEEQEDDEDQVKYKTYKIKSSKKLDKDDVEDFAEMLDKYYDIDEKYLKQVVRYSVNLDAKGSDNDKKLYIYVGKIKGKWYVIDQSTR